MGAANVRHSMAVSETGAAEAVALGYIGVDPEVRLLVPRNDVVEPELSIVIPALDEEVTVGDFVEWCREGLDAAGVVGEVLIVDSSADRTSEIALEHGARVLRTPRRGLGRAYIDALPYVRGEYILMGDADCTYDFRLLGAVRREAPRGLRVRHGLSLGRARSSPDRCRGCTSTSARP